MARPLDLQCALDYVHASMPCQEDGEHQMWALSLVYTCIQGYMPDVESGKESTTPRATRGVWPLHTDTGLYAIG
jgi:hypothetical protein